MVLVRIWLLVKMAYIKSSEDEAFGREFFGGSYFFHLVRLLQVHWRVVPLSAVSLLFGLLIAEAVRLKISESSLRDSMAVMLTISIFFCQQCIAQALVDAGLAYQNVITQLSVVVSNSNCFSDRSIAEKTHAACLGIIHTSRRSEKYKSLVYNGDCAISDLEIMAREERKDRDLLIGTINILHQMRNTAKCGGTLLWCRESMMDVILLTVVLVVPLSLLTILGRSYIIFTAVVVIVILGIYDMALAGTNPFSSRFKETLENYTRIVEMIDTEKKSN